MNEPRMPLNNKNWNDIDIFLFSNGQQSSPPRKYHLKSDELEFWESTIHYLARTLYGSMHSNIELYTLDGKKVDSPLQLVDAASYVAVKPPDAFIPAGYERYLIKATRSWEKRQEKLANPANATGEMQVIQELSKPPVDEQPGTVKNSHDKANENPNIQNPKSITEKEDSIGTNNTIIMRLKKENDRSFEEKQKEYKPFLARKSFDNVKNKIIKKNYSHSSDDNSKDDSIISKKRNVSVTKNVKCTSSRRPSMQAKNDKNNNKMNIINNPKEKTQPTTTKNPEEKEIKEIIVLSKPNNNNYVSDTGSDKGLITSSDVYKNPESEVQSIYIDVDRRTIPREYLSKEKSKSRELHKIEELNDELMNQQKGHKATSVQSIIFSTQKYGPEINTSFTSKAKAINIKLNIRLRDDRESTATERSARLGKCKSYTTLLTAEQGSQANINIDLNDDYLKYENSTLRRKSTVVDKAYLCSDFSDAKVVVVNCTCGLLEAQNMNNKSKENYIILVPSALVDKSVESYKSSPDYIQPIDKDCQKSRHSILNTESGNLRNHPVLGENSQSTIKHKVSICPDSPIKISAETSSPIKKPVISNKKLDQFTQTDLCNTLLQARPQANGNPSFHLPPLRLLAQYNLL